MVPQNQFIVIERFGKYRRTKKTPGLTVLCLPGLVDRIAPHGGKGDFKYHRINLYGDESGNLNFKDGSAKVRAQVWYRVMNPFQWVYVIENTENRIEEIFDGFLRPILQNITIDEAQTNLKDISDNIRGDANIKDALLQLGVEIDPKNGFILTDIILGEDIVRIRQESLQGKKDAELAAARGIGYSQAILGIIQTAQTAGQTISFEDAVNIYQTQRAMEAIQVTGANVTLVAENMKGAGLLIGVGKK